MFFLFFLSVILLINLYRIQIVYYNEYKSKSENNYIKHITIPGIRGNIYDRNGILIATNKKFYQIEILPEESYNINKKIHELKEIIDITDEEIENFNKKLRKTRKFFPIPIKRFLNKTQIFKFSVNQHKFPNFLLREYNHRYYPYGSSFTHAIGYVSKISEKDIQDLYKNRDNKKYNINSEIGKSGVEKYYENFLQGEIGSYEIEINNKNKIIRNVYKKFPKSGSDIYTTIDVNLQIGIEKFLDSNKAAVIVTDPRNGDILSLVSTPSYDPNILIGKTSKKDFQNLLDNYNNPFVNRVIQGLYPPASTAKPFIAIAALGEKVINSKSIIFDPGWWKLPNSRKKYRDWKKDGHGNINLLKAIVESSDTFFYQISYDMGIEKISNWMKKFGFGETTGIDIKEEKIGVMPTRDWKKKKYGINWYHGDTIPIGIGQGYWTATPIQISKALMILINNGDIKIPHILFKRKTREKSYYYKQKKISHFSKINSDFWNLVRYGMYGVAHFPNGTAHKNFLNLSYKAAVKSGTAQVFGYQTYDIKKITDNLLDHKLMIGFAPYNNPIVSVVAVLENHKSNTSIGELVRNIFDYVVLKKNSFSN
ncbi:penicillin-binding protein 2 [Candidatus Riesia sp. GBBU]|nr:penicillin-binding protein 2 [Candidatus Riesia sp. GBBU]